MPLSLTAEQKELLKIFDIREQYIIPPYQRPYSWEYDHCFQLYTDLQNSFTERQDYFIGNIIIAKAEDNRDSREVVDGQQRLITILLLFKTLSLFLPEMKILSQLLVKEDWEGENQLPSIRSDVFEAKDGDELTIVLSYTLDDIEGRYKAVKDKQNKIIERKCNSKFEYNILLFYYWLFHFKQNGGLIKEFTSFILRHVYLLPIELSGRTQDEANEKALVIFETINNRGMNLEDADIFKAKLYNRAKNVGESEIFIDLWTDFKSYCDNLNLSIDDVFRFYSHTIRGKNGITTSETSLREFFTNTQYSPFENNNYSDVLEDLFRIIAILELLNQQMVKSTEVAKWLQIVDAYTNQYPRYAVINYLFVNNMKIDNDFVIFLKTLIRYVYYMGSTATVKFEIYTIIKNTSLKIKLSSYIRDDIEPSYFDYLGRLKKGFALLAFYLNTPTALPSYNIDKIINLKDRKNLTFDWTSINLNEVIDSLGNFIILDIPKKNLVFNKKQEYYFSSSIPEVNSLFKDDNFTYEQFVKRDLELRQTLTAFFKGKI